MQASVPHSPEPVPVPPHYGGLIRDRRFARGPLRDDFVAGPVQTNMSPTIVISVLSFGDDTLSALIETEPKRAFCAQVMPASRSEVIPSPAWLPRDPSAIRSVRRQPLG